MGAKFLVQTHVFWWRNIHTSYYLLQFWNLKSAFKAKSKLVVVKFVGNFRAFTCKHIKNEQSIRAHVLLNCFIITIILCVGTSRSKYVGGWVNIIFNIHRKIAVVGKNWWSQRRSTVNKFKQAGSKIAIWNFTRPFKWCLRTPKTMV